MNDQGRKSHILRHLEERILGTLSYAPSVLLHGPRQCGKTTLARTLLEPRGYEYFDFDSPSNKDYAKKDVVGFVSELPEKVILAEVQNVPHIFSQLKLEIDRRRVNGRFFLTGSSFVLSLPKLTDSLAGRVDFLRSRPLSQSEIAGTKSDFIATAFGKGFLPSQHERLGPELREKIVAGGYPPALIRQELLYRAQWQESNMHSVFKRDLIELLRIGQPEIMETIMKRAAECTAGLQNINGMANDIKTTMPTAKRYLGLLENSFLLERLPSWHRRQVRRLVKAPKLHIGDTGLACALLKAGPDTLKTNRSMFGRLLETFVYQELRKQADWQDFLMDMFHFRHQKQYEVDIVLEGMNRDVVGVEVKASSSVSADDFRGLRLLAEAAGEKFVRGIVLYDGERCATLWKKFQMVPIRKLWEPE